MIAVLDTSALIRLFIPDGPIPDGLEELLKGASAGNDALIAPELLMVEAVQVLHKKRLKGLLSAEEFKSLLKDLLAVPVKTLPHKEFLPRAADIAHARKLTVYDALFLAVAEAKGARLVTADSRLAKAAGGA